ncbi:MAG: glycosyl hydrolase [Cytophagaceae bacterium]
MALILLSGASAFAQQVFPGGATGSYNLTLPPDDYTGVNTFDVIGGGAAGAAFITKGPGYTGPFQSHQWWTSALWNVNLGDGTDGEVTDRGDRHSERMYPYPMILTAVNAGFEIETRPNANGGVSAANQVNNGPVLTHMRVGFIGQNSTSTQVDGYGDWHAVFRQTFAGDVLKATTASGCPYLFLERTGNTDMNFFNQGTSKINAIYTDANVHALSITADPQNSAVTQGIIGLFFPPGTTIGGTTIPGYAGSVGGGPGSFSANFNADIPDASKFVAVAVLPDASQATLDLFAQHAFNFITQTNHTYSYSEANAMLTTHFDITTTNVYGAANTGTLQALYRHQWLYSPEAAGALYTGLQYGSPRGNMKLVNSNSFQTQMPNLGILPNLAWANTGNKTTLNTYITNYAATVAAMPTAADGYNKDEFMELTTNLQIAKQIGNIAAFNTILNELRSRLQDWLVSNDANYNRYFGYSPLFNHMSHYPNGFGSSGTMVDAHFHIGYIVMAAAILARYDAAFITNYGPMVETVIRSIDNETKDMVDPGANGTVKPWFPYLKYFDPYAGHSWADAKATNQESVSEAINFAAGVLLWGEATAAVSGNYTMRDLGALLYVTETEAARQYWFDVNGAVNGSPYATAYTHRHLTMLYNWGGNYATFFGTNPEYIHGITYLPATGASTWLGTDVAGAANDYSQISGNYGTWGGWGETINAQQAVHNPAGAIAAFNANSGGWAANKYAFNYQWDHTFDSVGTIDATVRADITAYQVFTKGLCKHYMIYMPKGKGPKTVTFTDGRSFNVPNDTVIVYKVCPTLPVSLISLSAQNISNQYNHIYWSTATEENNTGFEVLRSPDGSSWESIGFVSAQGNGNSIQNYELNDQSPLAGRNYYQLRQMDRDGNYSMSPVVQVRFGDILSNDFKIYPNPAADIIYIETGNHPEEYLFTLTDMLGKTCNAGFRQNTSGWTAELSSLPAGTYILQIEKKSGDKKMVKLVKN